MTGVPASIPSSGAHVTAGVSTTRDCTWGLTATGSWIQISPSSGQGEASITIVVGQNTAPSGRSATITINDTAVGITQDAAPAPPVPPSPPTAPPSGPNPPPPGPNAPTGSPPGSPVNFKATVGNVAGTCPSLRFAADGRVVVTDSSTRYTGGGNCADVRSGVQVQVEGELLTDGTVHATKVGVKKK